MKSEDYRADIDGLRAVAVLAVVFYHAFPKILPGGYSGVDVFFVISGYLITSIIRKELVTSRFTFSEFYSRRVRRIFPALSLTLSATLIAGWFFLFPEQYAQLGRHVAGGAAFVSNVVLWRESGYFDVSSELKPLLHLWSLGIEEQFYIFWPVLLFMAFRKRMGSSFLIPAVLGVSFIYNLYITYSDATLAFYSPFSRFWELSVGSALAFMQNSSTDSFAKLKSNPQALNVFSLFGLVLVLVGITQFREGVPYPGWRALLPTLGAFMIIASGREAVVNKKILSRKLMVGVGLISYPLYLWHWPIFSFLKIIYTEVSQLAILGGIAASFVLSWATYKSVELPIRHSKNRSAITRAYSGIMVALFLVGLGCHKMEGLPQRIPESLRSIASIKREDFKWEENVRSGGCHVYDPKLSEHASECIENKRPLVMLWGDSYAAALYPGLANSQKDHNYGIAQLTSAACPPILDINFSGHRENCDEINEKIVNRLSSFSPEVILLQTTWRPVDYKLSREDYLEKLRLTLQAVKAKSPSSRIYILGPVPRWQHPIQDCVVRYYRRFQTEPTGRMNFCLLEGIDAIERDMKSFASENQVGYFSLWDQFCNEKGCVYQVGPNWDDLESIDGGHLSPSASKVLMKAVMGQLFSNK